MVGRLRKPSPQFSPPPGVSQGFWLYQGSGAPVLDTTPRIFHDAQGPSRTYHCLDWRERWAHNLRLGFLYPPTQVSTATSQGCLYSCDACTLRAVHLLSHRQTHMSKVKQMAFLNLFKLPAFVLESSPFSNPSSAYYESQVARWLQCFLHFQSFLGGWYLVRSHIVCMCAQKPSTRKPGVLQGSQVRFIYRFYVHSIINK